jgi:hypothetical protein
MYFKPTGPLTLGGVLAASWRLCALAFRDCRALALLYALQSALLAAWLLRPVRRFHAVSLDAMSNLDVPALNASALQFARAATVPACVSLLVSTLLFAAMMIAPLARAAGAPTVGPLRALLLVARRAHWIVLGTALTTLMIVGGMLLLVPGLYWSGRVPMWLVPVLAEDASASRAIGRSWALTRGHWWRVSTLLSVALTLVGLGWAAGTWIGAELGGLAAPLLRTDASAAWLLSTLLANASCVFSLPYAAAVLVVLYDDLEMRAMLANARQKKTSHGEV